MRRAAPLLAACCLASSLSCGRAGASEGPAAAVAAQPAEAGAVEAQAAPVRRAPAAEATARPGPKPPYAAMRELEQMQDRIAGGDAAAAAAHVKAIRRLATAFAAARPVIWGEARNARALVLYLFSGGDAGTIARAVPRSALPQALGDLYEGALAYGLGDDDRARALLGPIDPRELPVALGGHLALVQAALLADPAKAIERLDLARLLGPGTLVEEAALRREMGLIDARTGDLPKFALLARRYALAFSRSLYHATFRQLVRRAALAVAQAGDEAGGASALRASEASGLRLALVTEALPPRDRRRLLLAVAREALVGGRMAMAALAAEQVLPEQGGTAGKDSGKAQGEGAAKGAGTSTGMGEGDQARARAYFGAATIAGPRHGAARAALLAAAGHLDRDDEALRAAALSVADTIRDPGFAAPPSGVGADAAVLRDGARALSEAEAAMKVAGR